MGNSSDEDDYMSDKFLSEGAKSQTSLLWGKHAREHLKEKKKKEFNKLNKKKPVKVLEVEKREEGLKTMISETNKGFAMLQKMGYKSGEGLGKNKSGRTEPIPISVKAGKTGLGKEEHENRKRTAHRKFASFLFSKKKKYNESLQSDFRSRMRGKFNERQCESDLYKSQKVCYQLHCESGIDSPEFEFFWPRESIIKADDDEEEPTEDLYSLEDKLLILTKYLRDEYFYCLWCAIRYSDTLDLDQNCPGDTSQHHSD